MLGFTYEIRQAFARTPVHVFIIRYIIHQVSSLKEPALLASGSNFIYRPFSTCKTRIGCDKRWINDGMNHLAEIDNPDPVEVLTIIYSGTNSYYSLHFDWFYWSLFVIFLFFVDFVRSFNWKTKELQTLLW